MSNPRKLKFHLEQLVYSEGVTLDRLDAGRCHIMLYLSSGDRTGIVTVSKSSRNRHFEKNVRADIRRFAKGAHAHG